MRIPWPSGECVTCHGFVGNYKRNNIKMKCKRLGHFKLFEQYLLFPLRTNVKSWCQQQKVCLISTATSELVLHSGERMRIPCGECVTCHRLVGNSTRNNAKCERLGHFKLFEQYLLFKLRDNVKSWCQQQKVFLTSTATSELVLHSSKRKRISWPCGKCVTCHGLMGNSTRNNMKCKLFEQYLLFPLRDNVKSWYQQ